MLKLLRAEGPGYVLADWPSHYALYDHNKGAQAAPRHDLYLFGERLVSEGFCMIC